MEIVGRRWDSGQAVAVEIGGDTIVRTRGVESHQRLPWIAPAFLDIQVNGFGGQEFSSAALDGEKVAAITAAMNAFGVARYCPTVTTERYETLQHAMRVIGAACDASAELAWRIAGIHLEGPYISREDGARGAHPLPHCRPPDWDEFQRLQAASGGRIRIHTLSPEYADAAEFIARVVASGVVVAIGHTAASPAQIAAAVDAGARLSTHLGNGAHSVLPRHPNYIWSQMADDRLSASLIADGHHLPLEVVKSLVRAKTPARTILVSDLSGLAGLPPGRYASNLCDLEILEDGRLVVAGQRKILAGASLPIGVGIGHLLACGLGLGEAVATATANPGALLGLAPASLRPGEPADLVLFECDTGSPRPQVHVRQLLVRGRHM